MLDLLIRVRRLLVLVGTLVVGWNDSQYVSMFPLLVFSFFPFRFIFLIRSNNNGEKFGIYRGTSTYSDFMSAKNCPILTPYDTNVLMSYLQQETLLLHLPAWNWKCSKFNTKFELSFKLKSVNSIFDWIFCMIGRLFSLYSPFF